MDKLLVEITPNYIYSEYTESCVIENRIVFQLRNPSSERGVSLINDTGRERDVFLPIDEAVPIPGLSMIYFKFRLGGDINSLTSAELFSKIQISVPDNWYYRFCYGDTLVLYPADNMEIETGEQIEFAIGHIRTQLPPDNISIFEVRCFNIDDQPPASDFLSIYKLRHPLCIRRFELVADSTVTGFRDILTFSWLVLGADEVIFSPGDKGFLVGSGTHEVELLKRTVFTLTARCGKNQVSKPCELVPLNASIEDFKCTYAEQDNNMKLEFTYRVKNTRHVYLSHVGRLPVDNKGIGCHELTVEKPYSSYSLSVENADGLCARECKPEP